MSEIQQVKNFLNFQIEELEKLENNEHATLKISWLKDTLYFIENVIVKKG